MHQRPNCPTLWEREGEAQREYVVLTCSHQESSTRRWEFPRPSFVDNSCWKGWYRDRVGMPISSWHMESSRLRSVQSVSEIWASLIHAKSKKFSFYFFVKSCLDAVHDFVQINVVTVLISRKRYLAFSSSEQVEQQRQSIFLIFFWLLSIRISSKLKKKKKTNEEGIKLTVIKLMYQLLDVRREAWSCMRA
jgi:hypothetical protein